MNLEMMKKRKKELGLTNQKLSELSGIPLGTVNKIFSGATKYPQYDTMLALETVLGLTFHYDQEEPYVGYTNEAAMDYRRGGRYTVDDYYALPDNVRAELIDGEFYYMAAPGRVHQQLLGEIYYEIKSYIRRNRGACQVYLSPFDVFLDRDERTVVQPDLIVVCNQNMLDDKGLHGAPDLVVEIISQSTGKKDYTLKLNKYCNAGVREYWIIDPIKDRIVTYVFNGSDMDMKIWGIRDRIPVEIYGDLEIDFAELDF